MGLTGLSYCALPALYALFVWWFSTGVIIYLDNLPRWTHRWSMLGATAILAVALQRLHAISGETNAAAAYAGFTYGLLVWGWQEMAFFMGFITGPVREPCPPDCTGWPCFVRALRACLYHELTSLVFGAAIVALTFGGANQVGTWTYAVLWAMRMSAKLNVLLGVRNLSEEFIPEHLAFIRSFLRQRPMNMLFPFSVTISTVAAVLLVQRVLAGAKGGFAEIGMTFIAVLLILAILEHWFLVLPLPATALWNWSLRASGRAATKPEARRPEAYAAMRWGSSSRAHVGRLEPARVRLPHHGPIGGDP